MTPHLALFFPRALHHWLANTRENQKVKEPSTERTKPSRLNTKWRAEHYILKSLGGFSQEIERLARCESQQNGLQLGCLTKSYLTAYVASRNSDYYVLVFGKRHAAYLDVKVAVHFKNSPPYWSCL